MIDGCKKIVSEVFLIDGNISEGEHLDEVWLEEVPWKGTPERVIVPYLKITSCSLLSILSTLGHGNPEGIRQDYLSRLNTNRSPIVNQYREGKVKSSPGGR